MQKRIDRTQVEPFSEVTLGEGERMLFCGLSPKKILSPVHPRKKVGETAMVTNRRLVVLSLVRETPAHLGSGSPHLTTIPLSNVDSMQMTYSSFDAEKALIFLVLTLLGVLPGLLYLAWEIPKLGPRVSVVSGLLRVEVKFSPRKMDLLNQFMAAISGAAEPRPGALRPA